MKKHNQAGPITIKKYTDFLNAVLLHCGRRRPVASRKLSLEHHIQQNAIKAMIELRIIEPVEPGKRVYIWGEVDIDDELAIKVFETAARLRDPIGEPADAERVLTLEEKVLQLTAQVAELTNQKQPAQLCLAGGIDA